MNTATSLRDARRRARLSQAELARRTGTSQATISAYENGRKQPSVDTFSRLLAASGSRLTVKSGQQPVVHPSAAQRARAGRTLLEVLALAEALPTRHAESLRFPRLHEETGK
jgi:transcriptional regulator with XRE-family HTH domain